MTADMANLSFFSQKWVTTSNALFSAKTEQNAPKSLECVCCEQTPYMGTLGAIWSQLIFWLKTEFFDDRGYVKPLIFEPKWVKT